MENEQNNRISPALLIFDAVFAVLVIVMIFTIQNSFEKKIAKIEAEKKQEVGSFVFKKLDLEAKAVYVFDMAKNKILFKKNETAQLPLASLVKLMTVLTASELLPKDSRVTVKREFLNEEGDSGLFADESWKLKNLLDFSLVVSSNDGARSVASVIGATISNTADFNLGRKDFIKKMNEKAKELNLSQTYFINESGLDEGTVSGGYGSAEDVEKLMQYILSKKPDLLEATKYKNETISSLSKEHLAKNTNTDVDKIPGLMASKTGYTNLAGGNLAIAFDASIGRPIIVVVLGSSEKGRFSDVNNLVKASIEYIRQAN